MASGRDSTLDFVKGLLVLGMALYHSLNYFRDDSRMFEYRGSTGWTGCTG